MTIFGPRLRKARMRSVDHRYREMGTAGEDPCVYCGVISSGHDHVPPISQVCNLKDVDAQVGLYLRKYPSCLECNNWLSDSSGQTMMERRAYIAKRIRKKYQHYLKAPQWNEEELSELSEVMAEEVRRYGRLSEHVKARVKWALS